MATFQTWADAPTPQNEASRHSFVEPLLIPLNTTKAEDSDEWEYEYSTTETETFYLTLDLTTPSIPTTRPRALGPNSGRVSTKTKWINPGLGRHKRQLGRAPTISLPEKDEEDANQDDSADEEGPDLADGAAVQDEDVLESDEHVEQKIQILELDSDNPLISYRDHTFTCQWTKNIGTELLFAPHENTDSPLPVLRHLPGGVDLLGACSARIISSTATVVPVTHGKPLDLSPYEEGPLVESVSIAASTERRNQARFLEQLMRIKERKGEEDEVTVVAYKRMRFHGWIEMIRKKLEEERGVLRQKLWNSTPEEAEKAKKRLEELDEQERNIPKDAPVGDDDDAEEVSAEIRAKRQKKRKEMLTEYSEEGSVKQKPRGFRRRPRGDWKRYNLNGTAASRGSAVNWQGVHTRDDAGTGAWNAGNGSGVAYGDAEVDADESLMPSAPDTAGQRGDYERGAQDVPRVECVVGQEPEMVHGNATEHVAEPEPLVPPGGFTGLLEGNISHLPGNR